MKKEKKTIKNNKKVNKNKKKIYIFWIIFLLFVSTVCFILPYFLYGKTFLSFFLEPKYYDYVCSGDKDTLLFPSSLNLKLIIARSIIPFILTGYILFVVWIKKNIINYRKVIYPIMYLLMLFIIYYIYLAFSTEWLITGSKFVIPANSFIYDSLVCKLFFLPYSNINFMYAILVKVGDNLDFKNNKSKNKKKLSILEMLILTALIFVIETILMWVFNLNILY